MLIFFFKNLFNIKISSSINTEKVIKNVFEWNKKKWQKEDIKQMLNYAQKDHFFLLEKLKKGTVIGYLFFVFDTPQKTIKLPIENLYKKISLSKKKELLAEVVFTIINPSYRRKGNIEKLFLLTYFLAKKLKTTSVLAEMEQWQFNLYKSKNIPFKKIGPPRYYLSGGDTYPCIVKLSFGLTFLITNVLKTTKKSLNLKTIYKYAVDILAVNIFFLVTMVPYEFLWVGLTWHEILITRISNVFINILFASFYSFYRDYINKIYKISKNSNWLKKYLADTFIFATSQLPIYWLSLLIAKASFIEIIKASIPTIFLASLTGRLLGLLVDFFRKIFRSAG